MPLNNKIAMSLLLICCIVVGGCSDNSASKSPAPADTTPGSPTEQSSESAPPEPEKKQPEWPFAKEEESPAELADNLLAKNYFLIFDGSGSMRDSECSGDQRKIDVAKQAVAQWSQGVPADANLGLFAFHNDGKITLPLTNGGRDNFISTIMKVRAGGNTPLAEATAYAYKECSAQAKRQLGYGEYTIVVVTDGIANSGSKLKKVIDEVLDDSPINIYSIGFCIGQNHSLNQPGRTIYKSADNPEQLKQGLTEVLAESESFDDSEFSK